MPLVSELFVRWDHRVKIQHRRRGQESLASLLEPLHVFKIYGIFNSKLHESQCDGENLIKIYGLREAQGAPGEGYSLTRSRAAYIGYSSGS